MPEIGDEWKPSQVRWVEKYTDEEKSAKHAAGDKETVLLQQEEARQIIEKMRGDEIMENLTDKMQFEVEPVPNHWIAKASFSPEIVDGINEYIEETEEDQSSYADRLVGQLRQDEKSSQVSFDLTTTFGSEFKTILNGLGSAYLQQAYGRKALAEVVDIWTNHAYAGDYNPLHDHGVPTQAGISGFIWTKLPESMSQSVTEDSIRYMNDASGVSDGCTQLLWGTRQRQDQDALFCPTEKWVKPEVGVMLLFPNWMKHQVMPFFGEGERRSVAFNFAVIDSQKELLGNMTPNEIKSYNENIQTQKDKRLEEGTLPSEPYSVIVGGAFRYVRNDIFV